MTEKVELPPAFLEDVHMTPKKSSSRGSHKRRSPRRSPRSEAESPPKQIGSLFHALSNKDKIRRDVDGPQFLRELNTKSPKKSPPKSPKRDRTPIKSRTPKNRSRSNSRKSRKGYDAQNLYSHLKNMSNRIEEEDRRKQKSRTPSPKYKTHSNFHPNSSSENSEEKALLLQSYHLLKQQGVKSEMLLDASADIVTIRSEVDRMRTVINSEKCIKFARKALIAFVSGIEFLNGRYDPFSLKLNGFSEHVITTLGDYDSVFLRLYDKYKDSAGALSPEAELLVLLGGSGLMFHITQQFVAQSVPKFTEVAKEAPELAEKIAGIMAKKYKEDPVEEDSSDEDESTPPSRDPPPRVKIPTEMLSTPAFPAMIRKMVSPRPSYTPPDRPLHVPPPMEPIKEIDVPMAQKIKPLKEKSENVLVIS